jgi:hypothetical protein
MKSLVAAVVGATVVVTIVRWALLGLGVFCAWEYAARDIWTTLPYIQWWQFSAGLWAVTLARKVDLG